MNFIPVPPMLTPSSDGNHRGGLLSADSLLTLGGPKDDIKRHAQAGDTSPLTQHNELASVEYGVRVCCLPVKVTSKSEVWPILCIWGMSCESGVAGKSACFCSRGASVSARHLCEMLAYFSVH